MNKTTRLRIVIAFAILTVLGAFFATRLKFAFSLDQFFPQGDPELEFFLKFTEEFETDINFLLVGVERKDGVFEQSFLEKFHDFSVKAKSLPGVAETQSLTKLAYPMKTPFGITTIPAIHIDKPNRYKRDKERILADERFVNQFISEDATALVMAIRTNGSIELEDSENLVTAVHELIEPYEFEDYHLLGPPNFQKEMVAMQKREVAMSTIVSAILVSLIMFFIFRRPWGIGVALVSIGLGMLLFLGLLGATGRPLNAMAALYPVLMVIVGTSDVIHIMSKYIDELRKGQGRREAIMVTVREIGMATLLTSLTTAIGFATLVTSKIIPIRDFGVNAAVGVLVAFLTVIFFTSAVLTWFRQDQIIKFGKTQQFWERLMDWFYNYTKNNARQVAIGGLGVLLICLWGISLITTNYRIERNMPRGEKITVDFLFFENTFSGFRPMEVAVFAQGDYKADDYEVLKEMDKVENYLKQQPSINSINSATTLYKSINQMYGRNKTEAYKMPEDEKTFAKYQKLAEKVPKVSTGILISKDEKKARISTRVLDIGADSIKAVGARIDNWIASNTDPNIATFKRTGTGLILDKNSEYVRDSLLKGLGLAVLIVSLLMALLFKNLKMVIISLVPNMFPLLMAGAMLGFAGVELEAGISIVFAVVFGIAVDDTIHFLSKFKLSRDKGLSVDESLRITFMETGKAICLTTIILFFGFLVMLFSIHPPSVTIGALISLTLFSALLSDLFLIPVLIRWMIKDEKAPVVKTAPVVEANV